MQLDADMLIRGCADTAFDSGLTIHSQLEPIAGPGAPVKPAVYEGGVFQEDHRYWPDTSVAEPVRVFSIDNVPSQANRLEASLRTHAEDLGLPRIVLDLSVIDGLPDHAPTSIPHFEFPHRNADAYLRDAEHDGAAFTKHEVGSALLSATKTNPGALFEWWPHALLFGFWQSHLGKKGPQTKVARSWTSEILGFDPPEEASPRLGVKGDPLNLSVDEKVVFDDNDPRSWVLESESPAGKKKSGKKEKLSEIGHGQVVIGGQDKPVLGAVSFRAVEQRSTVSFAGLRNIEAHDPQASAAGRALLVALGLVAHVGAFGRAFNLRSGCDLRTVSSTWTWLGETGDESVDPLDFASAVALFRGCVEVAESAGLQVGSAWATEPLRLVPNASLTKAIEATFPEFEL